MGRIKQVNPNNYQSSGNINAEFENVVRYLLASERGTKTLGEMLATIFDDDGNPSGIVDIRLDQSEGIQYRTGSYDGDEEGWETIVSLDDLRGADGVDAGTVVLPIITARIDYTGDGTETTFSYVHTSDDRVLAYKNGLLLREGALYDYTLGTDEVVFNVAPAADDDISFFKIRSDPSISSERIDQSPASTQTVFAYVVPDSSYELYVYKNGILLREGGSHDYIISEGTNSITFMSSILSSDTISFITVTSSSQTAVTGLMTEEGYVDSATGQILWERIGVENDGIAQSKVSGLTAALSSKAVLEVSATEPADPSTGDLWLDISVSPNVLRFFDGVQFVATSPENAIPAFDSTNAGQYLRINGTGTGISIEDIDLSGLIASSQKGAAGGVASLDSDGRIPEAQMPAVRATGNYFLNAGGAITDGAITVARTYKQTIRITAISALLTSGSCQIQLKIAGTLIGSVYAVSSTPLDQPLSTVIEIDSLDASKTIAVEVTTASSSQDLQVTLAVEFLE